MEKSKKGSRGSLTIEATVSLTLFIFLFMFFISYMRCFAAQSYIAHAAHQTGNSMALQSYANERLESEYYVVNVFSSLFKFIGLADDTGDASFANTTDWHNASDAVVRNTAHTTLAAYLGTSAENADAMLRMLCVKDGLAGIRLEGTGIEDGDLVLAVGYTLEPWFKSFFGISLDWNITQTVRCRLWSEGGVAAWVFEQ